MSSARSFLNAAKTLREGWEQTSTLGTKHFPEEKFSAGGELPAR
jgi:hypothetical protein